MGLALPTIVSHLSNLGTDIMSLSIIREIGSSRSYLSFLAYVNMSQFRKVNNSLLKVQVDVPDMKVKVE